MTVSRRHKKGRRAGGKTHTPYGRNGRVRRNAISANTSKNFDGRRALARISNEQWVVTFVTAVVGTAAGYGHVKSDDIASDIILELLNAGGFGWDADEIETFCRKRAYLEVKRYKCRVERSECHFVAEDGRPIPIASLASRQPAMQPTFVEAMEAAELLRKIPNAQRAALEILCDGGNPIDVAEEMGITPWAAIALIKEGREYVHRV